MPAPAATLDAPEALRVADPAASAQIMEALKAHRDILMGFIACCAIALGLVLLTRKREAL